MGNPFESYFLIIDFSSMKSWSPLNSIKMKSEVAMSMDEWKEGSACMKVLMTQMTVSICVGVL